MALAARLVVQSRSWPRWALRPSAALVELARPVARVKKETVERLRPAGRDRDGKPKPVGAPEPIKGVIVVPRRSGEGERGTIILDGWKLICPKGTQIAPSDQLRVRGKVYGIVGNPGDFGKKVIVVVESVGAQSGA